MAVVVLLALLAQARPPVAALVPAYVPERVYDTKRNAFADFEVMLAELTAADVIFVGEQHDDPNTHRLQQAMLDGLRRRNLSVTVSLEMFERDVQATLDRYLDGSIDEAEFLEQSRPWPRYATDYKPLVELAKAQGWPVLAANVPRRFAAEVARSGKSALDRLSASERALVARDLECPHDAYYERFAAAMSSHTPAAKPSVSPSKDDRARLDSSTLDRYYWSQCVKDETMAESIATAVTERRSAPPSAVVHFSGAFHSDFGAGAVERTRRRLDGRRIVVISILPVANIDTLAPVGDDLRRADFLVYTVK